MKGDNSSTESKSKSLEPQDDSKLSLSDDQGHEFILKWASHNKTTTETPQEDLSNNDSDKLSTESSSTVKHPPEKITFNFFKGRPQKKIKWCSMSVV